MEGETNEKLSPSASVQGSAGAPEAFQGIDDVVGGSSVAHTSSNDDDQTEALLEDNLFASPNTSQKVATKFTLGILSSNEEKSISSNYETTPLNDHGFLLTKDIEAAMRPKSRSGHASTRENVIDLLLDFLWVSSSIVLIMFILVFIFNSIFY